MKIPHTRNYKLYKSTVLRSERSNKLNFNSDGREHYVYRVTDYTRNTEQNYIGSHTPGKNKKYKSLIEEFWTYRTSSKENILNKNKKENYKVKILKVFNNSGDKYMYESFLHQYFNVMNSEYFWNKTNQTPFGFNTTGKTVIKDKDGKVLNVFTNNELYLSGEFKHINSGKAVVKDKRGNIFSIPKKDPRYLSGELVGVVKGKVNVKDKNNNFFQVDKDNPKYLSGELVGVVKGKVNVKDKEGNTYQVSINNPRYLSGELKHPTSGRVSVRDVEGNTFSIPKKDPRYLSGELVPVSKGFMPAKDKDGQCFSIPKNDPRLISGELCYNTVGQVTAKDLLSNKVISVDKDVFNNGFGNNSIYLITPTTKYLWIKNNKFYRINELNKLGISRYKAESKGYKRIDISEAREILSTI